MVRNETVRVVVVQGYCLLRKALVERLEKEAWIEVCALASGIDEARELIDQHRPHVLVMNVSLKCSVGVSSLKKLKRDFFGLAVVAFSCDSEFENAYVGQVLRAGADGYISSGDSLDNLVGEIRSARGGKLFLDPVVKSKPPHCEVFLFLYILVHYRLFVPLPRVGRSGLDPDAGRAVLDVAYIFEQGNNVMGSLLPGQTVHSDVNKHQLFVSAIWHF